jgi:hypothetical protein
MPDVIIGMDPHKHSATIEIIDVRERVLDHGRFATTTTSYRAMLAAGRRYPRRRWAIEGCNGIGRHIAQRLRPWAPREPGHVSQKRGMDRPVWKYRVGEAPAIQCWLPGEVVHARRAGLDDPPPASTTSSAWMIWKRSPRQADTGSHTASLVARPPPRPRPHHLSYAFAA